MIWHIYPFPDNTQVNDAQHRLHRKRVKSTLITTTQQTPVAYEHHDPPKPCPQGVVGMVFRQIGGLTNPRPWRGRCRAGFSNNGGSPLPRKRAPLQKELSKFKDLICIMYVVLPAANCDCVDGKVTASTGPRKSFPKEIQCLDYTSK